MIFTNSMLKLTRMRCLRVRLTYSTVLALFLLLNTMPAFAQDTYPEWGTEEHLGKPFFKLHTYSRLNPEPEKVRMDVAVEVIHDVLQFVREDDQFRAGVEVNISLEKKIKKKKYKLITRGIHYLKTKVDKYEDTNSRYDRLIGMFPIVAEPGNYQVTVVLTDLESKRRATEKRDVSLVRFNPQQIQFSDVISATESAIDKKNNVPKYPATNGVVVGENKEAYVFFDLWRPNPMDVVDVHLEFSTFAGVTLITDSLAVLGGDRLGTYYFKLSVGDLNFGTYNILLTANSENLQATQKSKFSLSFFGLPATVSNVDQAIEQLGLIADKDVVKKLRELPEDQRELGLKKFWDDHFPSTGEQVNGKMVEYYSRVNYSNQQFADGEEGWQTDRGMVYVVYGPPTEVDRQVFQDQESPYEIWYYSHLGKRFIFKDDHGFGDFRLVTPLW